MTKVKCKHCGNIAYIETFDEVCERCGANFLTGEQVHLGEQGQSNFAPIEDIKIPQYNPQQYSERINVYERSRFWKRFFFGFVIIVLFATQIFSWVDIYHNGYSGNSQAGVLSGILTAIHIFFMFVVFSDGVVDLSYETRIFSGVGFSIFFFVTYDSICGLPDYKYTAVTTLLIIDFGLTALNNRYPHVVQFDESIVEFDIWLDKFRTTKHGEGSYSMYDGCYIAFLLFLITMAIDHFIYTTFYVK